MDQNDILWLWLRGSCGGKATQPAAKVTTNSNAHKFTQKRLHIPSLLATHSPSVEHFSEFDTRPPGGRGHRLSAAPIGSSHRPLCFFFRGAVATRIGPHRRIISYSRRIFDRVCPRGCTSSQKILVASLGWSICAAQPLASSTER